MRLCVPDRDWNRVLLWAQKREGGPRLNGRADERVPDVDAARTDIVWGTVNDGPICHCVNAGEAKAPIGRGQKQLSLRVNLPRNELVSRLQEHVKLQVSEKSAVDLHKLSFNAGAIPQQKPHTVMSLCQQSGKPTTPPTSKLHRTPLLQLAAER